MVTAAVGHDPVTFAYGSQNWKSSDGQCNVGLYDSGARQMDCKSTFQDIPATLFIFHDE